MKRKNLLPHLFNNGMLTFISMTMMMAGTATAQVTFQKTYGGPEKEATFKLTKTHDGGYALAGVTESFGSIPADAYLIKTDANGVLLWSKVYRGSASDYATAIIETSDHGFLISGGTTSFGSGSDDALLLKTDSAGNIVWSKVYGGTQQEYFTASLLTADGGFIAVGKSLSSGAGSNDILVVRTDASGDTLWTRIMGGAAFEEATNVIQKADGGFALCGRSSSFTIANTDAVLMKLNLNGDTTWAIQYGNFGAEEAHSVKQTYDGGYILFGNATSFGNDYEVYLNHFNGNGNLLWSKLYGGPKTDAIYDGIITSDSGFAMCGFTDSYGEGHRGTDSSNYFLIRTNMNGDTLWTHTYGGDRVDESFGVLQADDGGFLVFGFSGSFGTDSIEAYLVKTNSQGISGCHEEPSAPHILTPNTIVSGFPAQITSGLLVAAAPLTAISVSSHENVLCLLNGMNELEMNAEGFVVFPNPFTNHATIKFDKEITAGTLRLYNMFGQIVVEKNNITAKETGINAENLGSGAYVFEVTEKEKRIYSGKAVVY